MWQYIIIGVVLAFSIYYIYKKIRETVRSASNPCCGCKGCAAHDKLKDQQKLIGQSKPVCYSSHQ